MINFSPIKFLQKTSAISNPISFKGIEHTIIKNGEVVLQEILEEDTFEKHGEESIELKPQEEEIQATKEKIASLQAQIKEKEVNLESLEKQAENKRIQGGIISKQWTLVHDKLLEIDKKSPDYLKRQEEEQSIYKDLIKVNKEMREIHAKVQAARKSLKAEKQYEAQLNEYLDCLKYHFKTAFLYNPDLDDSQKQALLGSMKDEIIPLEDFARELNLNKSEIIQRSNINYEKTKTRSSNWVEIDIFNNQHYIDTTFPKNIKYKTNHALLEENYISDFDLRGKYNFSDSEINIYFEDGCNLLDEEQKRIFEEHLKTTPVRSEKYYKSSLHKNETMVPVVYLASLGFGSVQDLKKAIQEGYLPGKITKKETPQGTKTYSKVNISSSEAERRLEMMRQDNKNLKTLKQFASMLKMKPAQIKEALINEELEIIHEYIFSSDYKNVFLDIRNPKNAQFIDKVLFERELEAVLRSSKLKKATGENSLRMKLAWHFCPKTRQIAHDEARQKGWVVPIITKKEDEGESALSEKEQIQLRSYYRNIWLNAGTDEFKEGIKKANEIMKLYKEGGIEAIDDPEIKEFIISCLND